MTPLATKMLTILTLVSLSLSFTPSIARAEPPAQTDQVQLPLAGAAGLPAGGTSLSGATHFQSASHLSKLSPELRPLALAGGEQRVPVMVLAQPGTDWHNLLDRPLTRKYDLAGLKLTSGWSDPAGLLKLASLPGVQAIWDARPMQSPKITPNRPPIKTASSSRVPTSTRPSSPVPDLGSQAATPADKANAAGFDGNGVIVAVMDTGIDFAHPDLLGTWARETNPASPYFGWPLIADADSIVSYISSGGNTANTWYADTQATFFYPPGSVTGTYPIFNGVSTHTLVFSNTSRSGVYHYGWHPDFSIGLSEEGVALSPLVLLVDETTAGVYDTVYVNLTYTNESDNARIPTYDLTTARPSRKGSEAIWADLDDDGLADLSGGILYWIADGIHVLPGSDLLLDASDLITPAAGSLVAFFGDYNGTAHGTAAASQIAAQGVISFAHGQGVNFPPLPDRVVEDHVIGGVLNGTAPQAKLLGGIAGSYDNWYLAAVGYDGIPGTADDAQVISNSLHRFDILPGWDYPARYVTQLLRTINPHVTLVSTAGSDGYSYGSMTANGASSSVLSVGESTLYGWVDRVSVISDTRQITADDVADYSNRGVNGLGQIKPQVLCPGNAAIGAVPVNQSPHPYDPSPNPSPSGQAAWGLFGETGQAASTCAGILATVYQAFRERTGHWPSYLEATRLLMNGADTLLYDSLSQGAGRANAQRATAIAAGQAGVYVSPAQWHAGDYRGNTYEAFAHIQSPGTTSSQVFTLNNWSSSQPVTVSIASDTLIRIGEIVTDFTSMPVNLESDYAPRKPDYLWRIDPLIPAGTDLVEINVYLPYDEFSLGNPADANSQHPQGDNTWQVRIYDWLDWNANGLLWNDINLSGTVDGGELDEPAADPYDGLLDDRTSLELNPLNEGSRSANTLQVRVQRPLQRMHDGLWLGLVHYVRSSALPQSHFQIRYTFYRHSSWSWLITTSTTLTVPANGVTTFTATLSVPTNTTIGLYQGALQLTGSSGAESFTTTIPVVVNVAATGSEFTVTGSTPSPYDNGRVFGGYDWRGSGSHAQGDWRLFFTDVPDETSLPENRKFLVSASWIMTPTDIDLFAYGPAAHESNITVPNSIIGPYNLAVTGSSPQTVHTTGFNEGWAYTFRTSSGGAQETIAATLQPGLNAFMVHNVLYDGPVTGEPYTLTVGMAAVTPAGLVVTATGNTLTATLTLVSPLALQAQAFGLSAPVLYQEQSVAAGTYTTYSFQVNNVGLLFIQTGETIATPDYDIDLYLERWTGLQWEEVAVSGRADASESIVVQLPVDGDYRLRVYGAVVPAGASYWLRLDRIQGNDLTVSGLPAGSIPADSPATITVQLSNLYWTGQRHGVIYLGPVGLPTALVVPVTVNRPASRLFLPLVLRSYSGGF